MGSGVKVRGEWGYESTLTTSGVTVTGGVAEPPLPSRAGHQPGREVVQRGGGGRAADRVRDDADLTQHERQQLERKAVQAAAAARAAETELRQFEAQMATARQEGVTARTQLTQREQQLTDAPRELTRPEGGTEPRANDLILAQQDRVKDI